MAPGSVSEVKARKKSAFSCEPCRQRKVKCGGEHPTCGRCAARGDACAYKLSPTLSYTQKLESRVVELESTLRRVQQPGAVFTGVGDPAGPMSTSMSGSVHGPSPTASASSPHSTSVDGTGPGTAFGPAFRGLSFDAKGAITYHGATSFFQLPSRPPEYENTLPPIHEAHLGKDRLVKNAWEQRALEVLAATPEPFQYLLNNHWCWIQPLFNFVYRPAFTRDMQRMGPYYSHTLLNAMLGHSIRWCRQEPEIRHMLEPYDGGELFKRHARTLLFEEVNGGNCSVPTIQTLLLLSAQECSAGNRTQAWVYCGMAFRLLEDMGITFDGQRYAGSVTLSDEDIEIRRRLFWSCYFWDKIISLYLGRSPSLQHSPISPPQIIMDDSAEDEPWIPHGVTYSDGAEYPFTKARSISCFTQMCRLSAIFNEILVHIYDPVQNKTEQEVEDCIIREGFTMRQWWQDLPSFLKIDALSLPDYCPPSHIVTLNCLFHTFKILLYRPMLFKRSSEVVGAPPPPPSSSLPSASSTSTTAPAAAVPVVGGDLGDPAGPATTGSDHGSSPAHFKECLSSATAILAIFDLHCRTFGHSRVILSMAYSVYTAASIFLLQIQASTGAAREDYTLQSMRFCVQALDQVKESSPVIGDALNLILKALADAGIDPSTWLALDPAPSGDGGGGGSGGGGGGGLASTTDPRIATNPVDFNINELAAASGYPAPYSPVTPTPIHNLSGVGGPGGIKGGNPPGVVGGGGADGGHGRGGMGETGETGGGGGTYNAGFAPRFPQAPAAFNPDGMKFTPEMFEAFSSLEPISATVGAKTVN